jgi:hypothetical protein
LKSTVDEGEGDLDLGEGDDDDDDGSGFLITLKTYITPNYLYPAGQCWNEILLVFSRIWTSQQART